MRTGGRQRPRPGKARQSGSTWSGCSRRPCQRVERRRRIGQRRSGRPTAPCERRPNSSPAPGRAARRSARPPGGHAGRGGRSPSTALAATSVTAGTAAPVGDPPAGTAHGASDTAAPTTDRPSRRDRGPADLQRLAQSMGITGTGRMRKSQLIEAIQSKQGGERSRSHRAPRLGTAPRRRAPPAGNGSGALDNSVQRGASAGAGAPRHREQDAMEPETTTQPAQGDAAQPSSPAKEAATTALEARRGGSRDAVPASRPRRAGRTGCPGQRRATARLAFSPSSAADTATAADAGQAARRRQRRARRRPVRPGRPAPRAAPARPA